ncbi:4'-phosphopantetheinyl transferase family protein [Solimicrobium silvestre]|uniref:4'-phosphopantetheinyl transferase superfamily n=1 Tax=Solimicrobium silvestre TaxID=2099400 RepID=A0A2S9H313_9BURK|nr:4'-phosphopantetheinyl transferase superfamily protein [Solimicrobium silvestre]PRC94375.1 4'-phosphopantetheinyl transferase superfamily [Solimicrobium silvestre]
MDEAFLLPPTIDPLGLPAHNAVAIYLLELDHSACRDSPQRYLSLLAALELANWQKIRPVERQWQYLQSRVLQRLVLGAYAECDPRSLTFHRDEWGRPTLAEHGELHFSLSHCASHVALAVGSDSVLGVDVETVVPVRSSFMHIACKFFHPDDLAQLMEVPEEQRYGRFLEQWTLKEAHLKALGLGMHKSMADCRFERTSAGLIVAHDRAPVEDRVAPNAFIAQRRMRGCQLALAYRYGRPVRFRYLNGDTALPWQDTS